MTKRTSTLAWIATLTLSACAASTTQAKFVMTLQQTGANVIGIGNGSIDLTDFGSPIGSARNPTELAPNASVVGAGSSDEPGPDVELFHGAVTTPSNFGPGGQTLGESIGDPIFVSSLTMGVPIHYIFGAPLSNRSFYIGDSFASLGVNPGSYVWSWGSGAHADTFTLNVLAIGSPAVPEPSTWATMLLGFAGLAYTAVRRKGAVRAQSEGRGSIRRRRLTPRRA